MGKTGILPPRIARFLVDRFTRSPEKSSVSGDLDEMFTEIAAEKNRIAARLWYYLQTIKLIGSFLKHSFNWSMVMVISYVRSTLRVIQHGKLWAAVNIVCLAVGIANGSEYCVAARAAQAKEAGATRDELLETARVGLLMGGSLAFGPILTVFMNTINMLFPEGSGK